MDDRTVEIEMNGGEALAATLGRHGVEAVFFVAGGTYVTVLEALSRQNTIRAIPTRLESSAVFAAEAYAALRKKPACVFVSRAPGATNAAIGVHTAMQASRPVVLFIADIPRAMKQREAFQEVDYRLMYAPIAKAVLEVNSFDELPAVAARALGLAVSGRPGPVVVAVSRDILDGRVGVPRIPSPAPRPSAGPEAAALSRAATLIDEAARPLIIAGEMVHFERAHDELLALAEASGAGVLAAYRQQDVFPNEHPAWIGQLALNRAPHIEQALDECDLLISVGSRLDSVTTDDYAMLRDGQRLVMVYPEPDAFSQWQPEVSLLSDAVPALSALTAAISAPGLERREWVASVHAAETEFSAPGQASAVGKVSMAGVIETFKARVPDTAILVADAGTFGRWIQRFYRYNHADTSLGPISGAMGYGVPGGIGAAVADPGRSVFVWVGDGGFQMTGHEVATIVQEQLPVKIIVCDNAAWGSILVYEQKRFPGLDFGTRLKSPDFTVLGQGYGLPSFRVSRTEEFESALDRALQTDGPALIHLHLDVRDVSPYPVSAAAAAGSRLGD